jgi:hypothetical protein
MSWWTNHAPATSRPPVKGLAHLHAEEVIQVAAAEALYEAVGCREAPGIAMLTVFKGGSPVPRHSRPLSMRTAFTGRSKA